jgi:hypothetical protein
MAYDELEESQREEEGGEELELGESKKLGGTSQNVRGDVHDQKWKGRLGCEKL